MTFYPRDANCSRSARDSQGFVPASGLPARAFDNRTRGTSLYAGDLLGQADNCVGRQKSSHISLVLAV